MTAMDAVLFDRVSVELDGRPVLEEISFRVREGAFLGVIGPNGAGKTTLLRTLLGLVPATAGKIDVLGRPAGSHGGDAHAIGYVPQRQSVPRNFPATVADVVMMGRLCCNGRLRLTRAADWARVRGELEEIGIGHLADRPIGRLSGGEVRRVLLAQALCTGTRLLVLDEPTVGLDPVLRRDLWTIFHQLAQRGVTLLVSSHVMDEAVRCDRLLLMREGRMLADDTLDGVLAVTGAPDAEQAFLTLIDRANAQSPDPEEVPA
jgi:ABC-type Mn2+/Zn2+ transport system ATPase subunit